MLVNLSNHPIATWAAEQRSLAERLFGTVEDLAFPVVDPASEPDEVTELARAYVAQCLNLQPAAIHVMGELTFCLAFVAAAQQRGLRCIASTTERSVKVLPNGDKQVAFRFVRFRDYQLP